MDKLTTLPSRRNRLSTVQFPLSPTDVVKSDRIRLTAEMGFSSALNWCRLIDAENRNSSGT